MHAHSPQDTENILLPEVHEMGEFSLLHDMHAQCLQRTGRCAEECTSGSINFTILLTT